MIFALPALALLTAEGLEAFLAVVPRHLVLLRAMALAIVTLPPIVLGFREVVFPHQRPETAAAAQVVLAGRRAGEPVGSNHWEYQYYLRQLGADYVHLDDRPLPSGRARAWCVVHGPTRAERVALGRSFAGGSYRVAGTVAVR
jgi:hypothetical protein